MSVISVSIIANTIVFALVGYFLYTGVINIKASKTATGTSIPNKRYLFATGIIHVALAAILVFVTVFLGVRFQNISVQGIRRVFRE